MSRELGPKNKIVALLPAHNEAESIGTTLRALAAQTRVPDRIIVICDNCTDATAEIARGTARPSGPPAATPTRRPGR